MDIAKAIRIARAARGLSKKDLALRAGVDASYISRIESGARVPRHESLASIASALSVPLDLLRLFGGDPASSKRLNSAQAGAIGAVLLRLLLGEDEEDHGQ